MKPLKERMCGNKIKYVNFIEAQQEANKVGNIYRTTLYGYKCKFCIYFHIGHKK